MLLTPFVASFMHGIGFSFQAISVAAILLARIHFPCFAGLLYQAKFVPAVVFSPLDFFYFQLLHISITVPAKDVKP